MSAIEAVAYQTGTCHLSFAGDQCAAPSVSTWQAGCVHEHVDTDLQACAVHEPMVTDRPWFCSVCEQGDDPHKCPVVVRKAEAGQ